MIVPVYVPTFMLAFGQGMLIPTLPVFVKNFGVSFSLVGIAVAAAGIGTLIADVPVGIVLSRLGRRRAMLLGITMVTISTLLVGLLHNYPVVFFCRLVEGVGTALWGISRHAYITDVAPRAQRGKFLATFGGINRCGLFAGPFIGGTISDHFGMNIPFILAAALSGVAGILAVAMIRETGIHTAVVAHSRMRWHSVGKLMQTHRADLSSAGAAQIFVAMIRSGRQLIIPLVGAYTLGMSTTAIGTVVTVAATVDMVLFLPAGWMMDRFGRKVASVPAFGLMGVGMALIPLAHSFSGLLLAASVIGFGNGLGSGSMMTLGADLAPPDAVGEFLGIWRFVGDLGQASGPLTVGFIAGAMGLTVTAFCLAGLGFVAAGILSILVRETLIHDAPVPVPVAQKQ